SYLEAQLLGMAEPPEGGPRSLLGRGFDGFYFLDPGPRAQSIRSIPETAGLPPLTRSLAIPPSDEMLEIPVELIPTPSGLTVVVVELALGGARLMPIRAWMSSPARPRALPLARGSCGGCRLIVQLPDTGLPRDDELTAAARLVVDLLPSDGPALAGVVI